MVKPGCNFAVFTNGLSRNEFGSLLDQPGGAKRCHVLRGSDPQRIRHYDAAVLGVAVLHKCPNYTRTLQQVVFGHLLTSKRLFIDTSNGVGPGISSHLGMSQMGRRVDLVDSVLPKPSAPWTRHP